MSDGDLNPQDTAGGEQRIDKWLWCARFFKTRSLASKFVSDGRVRLTRGAATTRVAKPSAAVRPGDGLTFLLRGRVVVIKVAACALRRGPASEAQELYADQSPAPAADHEGPTRRERVGRRPTKRDRRALDAQTDRI
ncbi:MAG: RNA-binding S4 domain-containing protein [Pseudomonadota bacterium]